MNEECFWVLSIAWCPSAFRKNVGGGGGKKGGGFPITSRLKLSILVSRADVLGVRIDGIPLTAG